MVQHSTWRNLAAGGPAIWLVCLLGACSESQSTPQDASNAGAAGVGGNEASAGAAGSMGSSGAGDGGVGGTDAMGGAGGAAQGETAGDNQAGHGGSAGDSALPDASGVLCVFDYDLTLSTNACGQNEFACRTNTCITYNWYEQCMSSGAREAIATCVERGAFIGIASHATLDECWEDKVTAILMESQFPDLTDSPRYDNADADFAYPKLDNRDNWNCDDCAYHMNGALSKPQLISRVMRHYGLDPESPTDRANVIFWDDMPGNINQTNTDLPEVHTVQVVQNVEGNGDLGGCGIQPQDIQDGWAPLGF